MLHYDNQSTIDLSGNTTFHSRTKYIDVRFYWISDVVEEYRMQLVKINTNRNPSYLMKKPISKEKYEFYKRLVEMASP